MRYQNINPRVLAETKTGTRRYRSRNFHRFIRYWVHLAAATRKASTPSLSLYRWQKRNLLDINHLWVTHVTIGLSFESHLTGQKLFFSFLFLCAAPQSTLLFFYFIFHWHNKLFFFFLFHCLYPPVGQQTIFLLFSLSFLCLSPSFPSCYATNSFSSLFFKSSLKGSLILVLITISAVVYQIKLSFFSDLQPTSSNCSAKCNSIFLFPFPHSLYFLFHFSSSFKFTSKQTRLRKTA